MRVSIDFGSPKVDRQFRQWASHHGLSLAQAGALLVARGMDADALKSAVEHLAEIQQDVAILVAQARQTPAPVQAAAPVTPVIAEETETVAARMKAEGFDRRLLVYMLARVEGVYQKVVGNDRRPSEGFSSAMSEMSFGELAAMIVTTADHLYHDSRLPTRRDRDAYFAEVARVISKSLSAQQTRENT